MSITGLSLFKRSNGMWYIVYTNREGRQQWKSTGSRSKSDALQCLTEFKHLLLKRRSSVKSLSTFTEEFLEYASGVYATGNVTIYRGTLNLFLQAVGDLPLAAITPKHIDQYKSARVKLVKPITVNLELRTLKAAFNTAKRWKLISENPFDEVKRLQIPDAMPTFFTKSDLEKLLRLVREPWLRDVIIFAVATGLRRGELVNLTWDNVNFEKRYITIQSSPTFRTKLGKRRIVPLNDIALHVIKSQQSERVSDYVFTLNGRKILAGWIQAKFKRYVRLANLDGKLHFHSLRHTFASWLVQDGVSLYEVQRLLGHSNPSVTEVYAHLQPELLYSSVNRIILPLPSHAIPD